MSVDAFGGNHTTNKETQDNSTSVEQGNQANSGNTVDNNQNPQVGVEYNGKFWTQEEILNKFQNADKTISEYKEKENQFNNTEALREDVLSLIEQVNKGDMKATDTGSISNSEAATNGNTNQVSQQVNENIDFESVARKVLQETTKEQEMEANKQVINQELFDTYGEKSGDFVQEKASKLGFTVEEAEAMAKSKPEAFRALFLNGSNTNASTAPKGTINPSSINKNTKQNENVDLLSVRGGRQQASILQEMFADLK